MFRLETEISLSLSLLTNDAYYTSYKLHVHLQLVLGSWLDTFDLLREINESTMLQGCRLSHLWYYRNTVHPTDPAQFADTVLA